MNKAFVREPDFDGRAYCPKCGSLGTAVTSRTLDHHVRGEWRTQLGEHAWYCSFADCDVAYFDLFERSVTVDTLHTSVYPKDPSAPICACFGFTTDDIAADVEEGTPTRIRELLAKSESAEAQCHTLAADGRSCMREVQRLYLRATDA
ncbi:MAG: hypothetical protein KDA93_06920 [Planctomycetaceae bacterium]|nr:hypothetical protein [Planctomycetaceae bacterium]